MKLEEHHQISGCIALRSVTNALQLCQSIEKHCNGNPFKTNSNLKNLASSAIVPEDAKDDILHMAEKGQEHFEKFVNEKLQVDSNLSVWDSMKKTKLHTFANMTQNTKIALGDKVIKLREE